MDVLIVLVFVSLLLVTGSIVLFVHAVRQRDFEHAERLSLLPILEPAPPPDRDALDAPDGGSAGLGADRPPESPRS